MAKEFKKLDMHQPPIKTRWYILPILWFLVDCALIGVKHKIIKENFKKIKGVYHGFDYLRYTLFVFENLLSLYRRLQWKNLSSCRLKLLARRGK